MSTGAERPGSRATVNSDFRNLPDLWHSAPARWGNRLHSICSYMAMFPPTMPRVFIDWLTKPGDVCYDPFAGRGTVGLEAALSGRIGYLSDANPLAWVLSAAKVDPPRIESVLRRLDELEPRVQALPADDEPERIRMLFSERTLGQLLWLKGELRNERRVDRFISALVLGILHARMNSDGTAAGLSVPMPNTFAMAPRYVARYVEANRLAPPDVDVIPKIRARALRLPPPTIGTFTRGSAWRQDVRRRIRGPVVRRPAKLIFTSPPYLEVMRYGKLNWIRLWFLDHAAATVDSTLFSSGSVTRYVEFIRTSIDHLRPALRDDGYLVLVVGDVRRDAMELNLADLVAEHVTSQGTDLRLLACVEDRLPVDKKVSRIWGASRGRATRTDRLLVFGGPKSNPLKGVPSATWT